MDFKYEFQHSRKAIRLFMSAISIFLLIVMVISFIKEDSSTGIKIALFTVVFNLLLLSKMRERIRLYDDFLSYRYRFRTRDIYYSDINKVKIERKGLHQRRKDNYYVIYDINDEELLKIPMGLFTEITKQGAFLTYLYEKNNDIDFDQASKKIMEAVVDLSYSIDVLEGKAKKIILIVLAVIIAGFLLAPLLFYALFATIEKVFN